MSAGCWPGLLHVGSPPPHPTQLPAVASRGPRGQQEERSASLLAGRTTIGTAAKDIVLQGPGLAPEHCYIENARGTLTLHPCGNACAIDGVKIQRPTRLTQGRAVPRSWVLAAPEQELAPVGRVVPSDAGGLSGAILPLLILSQQLLAGAVPGCWHHLGGFFLPQKNVTL